MTTITVISPWLDCHELSAGYWRAIEAGLAEGDRVIVVDNGSSPPLAQHYLERTGHALPAFATVLRSTVNLGFSRACNAAAERAGTDAVLFLNNDVVMTDSGWLAAIRRQLQPGVLVGAELRNGRHTEVDGQCVPYLDGWCVALMLDGFKTLGGWDELEEPSYYGDNLLCARATAAGMLLATATVGLRHLENYTSRRMPIGEVSERNRLVYERTIRKLRLQAVAA